MQTLKNETMPSKANIMVRVQASYGLLRFSRNVAPDFLQYISEEPSQ
jgi:hypothetical protein